MGDAIYILYVEEYLIYLQTPSPVHNPHKMAEDTRRNMTPEKKYKLNN